MVGIGINENVFLLKAERSDKGALVLTFSDQAEKSDFFTMMNQGTVTDDDGGTRIYLFPPNVPKDVPGKPVKSREQKVEMVQGDIGRRKQQLVHILGNYMTSDKAALDNWHADTGLIGPDGKQIDAEEQKGLFLDQQVLTKIGDNLFDGFLEKIEPFVGRPEPEFRFRLKLQRRDKDKNFPDLPDRYLSTRPFMEPMSIPLANANVKFDEWEIKQGLNDPTPPSRTGADTAAGDPAPANDAAPTAASVFGKR